MKKNHTKIKLIFLKLQLGIICFSFGPLISNYASKFKYSDYRFQFSIIIIIILLGFYFYIWQSTLRKIPLSIAYSYRSTLLIWSLLWSYLFANQVITFNNLIGSILILIGILFITND